MKKSVKANLVSATLAASLLLSTTGAFAFTDVDANHWAENDIAKLSNAGYINGYEDGSFAPNAFITRAEFVTIINKVKGATARSYKSYPDVSADAWYADQIDIAATAGFITGYDDGSIRPDACISRAEVAVVCYKAWNLSPEGQLYFTDSGSIGSWAQTQIATLVSKNVLSGYEDGSFRPGDAITRAEVAKIVSRMIDMSSSQPINTNVSTPVIPGAGLSNTSVVIKGGSSGGSSGSSGSSSSTVKAPTAEEKKALNKIIDDDPTNVTVAVLETVLEYAGDKNRVTVDKEKIDVYQDAVAELVANISYSTSTANGATKLADDVSTVILATNEAVDKVVELANKGELNRESLAAYKSELDNIIKKNATSQNVVEIQDLMSKTSLDMYAALKDEFGSLNDKDSKVTTSDVLELYAKYKNK